MRFPFTPRLAFTSARPRSAGSLQGSGIALLIIGFALGGAATTARGEVITQWNFNGPLTGTLLPSFGVGTLRPAGVGSSGFGSGAASGGSSDPISGNPPNYGWQVSGFPGQGNGTGTAGIQGSVDVSGFSAIRIAFDLRASAGSARHQQFQFALGGSNFIDFGAPLTVAAPDRWTMQRSFDLGTIVDDSALLSFRVTSVFAPGTSAYEAASATSGYSAQGTWRFDMLTVLGERIMPAGPGLDTGDAGSGTGGVAVVPLPASVTLMLPALGLLGLVARRRRGTPRPL